MCGKRAHPLTNKWAVCKTGLFIYKKINKDSMFEQAKTHMDHGSRGKFFTKMILSKVKAMIKTSKSVKLRKCSIKVSWMHMNKWML